MLVVYAIVFLSLITSSNHSENSLLGLFHSYKGRFGATAWSLGSYVNHEGAGVRFPSKKKLRWYGTKEGFSRQFQHFSCMIYAAEQTKRTLVLGELMKKVCGPFIMFRGLSRV
jgi:hypothetical protein